MKNPSLKKDLFTKELLTFTTQFQNKIIHSILSFSTNCFYLCVREVMSLRRILMSFPWLMGATFYNLRLKYLGILWMTFITSQRQNVRTTPKRKKNLLKTKLFDYHFWRPFDYFLSRFGLKRQMKKKCPWNMIWCFSPFNRRWHILDISMSLSCYSKTSIIVWEKITKSLGNKGVYSPNIDFGTWKSRPIKSLRGAF